MVLHWVWEQDYADEGSRLSGAADVSESCVALAEVTEALVDVGRGQDTW